MIDLSHFSAFQWQSTDREENLWFFYIANRCFSARFLLKCARTKTKTKKSLVKLEIRSKTWQKLQNSQLLLPVCTHKICEINMKISMHSYCAWNSIKWFNMCCCGGSNQFACIDSSTLHCGIDKKKYNSNNNNSSNSNHRRREKKLVWWWREVKWKLGSIYKCFLLSAWPLR